MGRRRLPGGERKSETVTARVTPGILARVDEAAGPAGRSAWLEALIKRELGKPAVPAVAFRPPG